MSSGAADSSSLGGLALLARQAHRDGLGFEYRRTRHRDVVSAMSDEEWRIAESALFRY